MGNPGRRDERQHAVEEADPCPQDRRQDQLLALYLPPLHRLKRRLDGHRLERKVPRDLVREEHADLVQNLAEPLGRAVLVPQVCQLVLHERVINHRDPSCRHRLNPSASAAGAMPDPWPGRNFRSGDASRRQSARQSRALSEMRSPPPESI